MPRYSTCIRSSLYYTSPLHPIAMRSITVIGYQVSYAIPLVLRVIYRENFKQGAFNLGKYSLAIHTIASIWVRVWDWR